METAEHVRINQESIGSLATELVEDYDFTHASWDAPVYPSTDEYPIEDVVDFIMVGNTLNYCFSDLETGAKYTTEYLDTEWRGAFGMWAALRRAYDNDLPILSPNYLQDISREDIERIFEPAGDTTLPMLSTRVVQLRSIGELMEDFGGTFRESFVEPVELYGPHGVVETLAKSSAYRDRAMYNGHPVRFDKRAQLTVSMLYGKLLETPYAFEISDIDEFTIFPDYGIPAGLAAKDVLQYSNALAETIDSQELIPAGSNLEVEIRAATVVAGELLKSELETTHDTVVSVPVLDFVLWQMRTGTGSKHHLTRTTAY